MKRIEVREDAYAESALSGVQHELTARSGVEFKERIAHIFKKL